MTFLTVCGRMRAAVQTRRPIAGPRRFKRVGFPLAILSLSVSLAAAEPAKRLFNIEAKPATQSLTDYAEQAYIQLGYDVDIVDDILTNAVVGEYDSAEALELLLKDTGLEAEHGERGIFIRRVPEREGGGGIEERTQAVAETSSLRFTQTVAAAAQAAVAQNQSSQGAETDSGEDEEERPLEEIIVTGTNIRGIAPESSPTRTFTREDIDISGVATAQDFIQLLPQNFGGGSNPDLPAGLPNDTNSSFNVGALGSMGSSVNLRGLGSASTLVLLNGHRLAPSSGIGDFFDVSMIPASVIERVEMLTDGASSIYGSDAVAGVVNFILRDDFDGVEGSFRYGVATQNGAQEEFRASLIGGLNWEGGNALLSYEYFDQDQIRAQDRAYSQGAALPNDLQPSQERHSVFGTVSQELGSNSEIFADAVFSRREAKQDFTSTSSGLSFRSMPIAKNLSISAGGSRKISDLWFLDFAGTFGKVDTQANQMGMFAVNTDIDSEIWVADIKTSGSIFTLPAGDVKLAIGGHYRNEDFRNFDLLDGELDREADREVFSAYGEVFIPMVAPDNSIPGIERFELNISGRFDDFSDFGSTTNPKVGILWSPVEGLRLRSSYSTSFNPPPLGRVGATDFSVGAVLTAASNAIFGLTPADPSIADVVSLTAFGTGKDLGAEDSTAFTAGLDFSREWDSHQLAISTTWFDIEFENRLGSTPIPGNVTPFDAPNIAFNDPSAFPPGTVIFSPSQEQIIELVDSADRVTANSPPLFGDPLDAEVINLVGVVRNLGLTQVSGLDFDVTYTLNTNAGDLVMGVDGTYLKEFSQQAAATTPAVEQINTLFNPVDLKLRGRIGYVNAGLTANTFVNYINDYRVDNTADAGQIGSWTTVDVSSSYNMQSRPGDSFLSDIIFRLSVLNVFDVDPPSTPGNPNFRIFGYDPTNASPLGRFIAFEITKRF